jgi:hypothetical protein
MVPEPFLFKVIAELSPIQELNNKTNAIARGKKHFAGFMDVPL